MRRSTREIKDIGTIANLLNTTHVGRLGTVGKDGCPMIKPLNFAYDPMKIYFHGANEGEKIEDITRDNRVCFEVDRPIGYKTAKAHACEASYSYQSVIIKGKASIVTDGHERLYALKLIMDKYQPGGDYGVFKDEKVSVTAVIKIDVEEIVGKENIVDLS